MKVIIVTIPEVTPGQKSELIKAIERKFDSDKCVPYYNGPGLHLMVAEDMHDNELVELGMELQPLINQYCNGQKTPNPLDKNS